MSCFKGVDVVDGLLQLTSGLCGIETFEQLRKVIGRETKTIEEWVVVAENLPPRTSLEEAA